MDKSRIYQSSQKYDLGNGSLYVNTFNGRILYSYPIATVGLGNFQINTSLIYNSFYKDTDFGNIKIGFGNGWKFNIEEYVFPYKPEYNIDGFNFNDYVYIDSNWCIHRFVKYKEVKGYDNPRKVYYDESGTGLKLIVVNNSNYKMIDEYNNISYFDLKSGKLISSISSVNSLITKIIEYDETKNNIISIYDSRKESKRIKFEYNQNNLPIKIYLTNSKVYYTFEYSETKLVKIYKENGNEKKTIHEFWYHNFLMNTIVNSEDLQAIKLEYKAKSESNVLKKITLGALKKELVVKNVNSETYCGEDDYVGENDYVTDSLISYSGNYSLIMPDEYILSYDVYDFQSSYTEFENFKGIKNRLYFDIDGRTISNLEYNNISSETHYYTSSKPTGWEIGKDGDSNIFINDKKAKTIYKNGNKYVLDVNENLNKFLEIFNDTNEETSEHFTVSFWLMFNKNNDSTLLAKLKYKLNKTSYEEHVIIKNTLGGVWQYVSIPLNLGTSQKTLENILIELDVDDKLTTINDEIYIADVRINKGCPQIICIDNAKVSDKTYEELKIGSNLYYCCDGEERKVTLSPKFYLTEEDIIATYRSIYYYIQNNATSYELFYCNKTKVMDVSWVSMFPFDLTNENISKNHKYYTFNFLEYDDTGNGKVTNTPNYHFRTIDLVAIKDDKKSYRITEIQRKVESRGDNRYYFKTYTLMGIVENNESVERLNETNSVCNVTEENDDGTQTKTNYIKKIYNNNNELEKEVNIITENIYDEYGNILKVITKAEGSTDEKLTKEYNYCENNPMLNEKIYEIIEDGNIISTTYNSNDTINSVTLAYDKKYIDGNVKQISKTKINMIKYSYDDFEDLISLKYYDKNNTLIGENKLTYNNQGLLNNLSDKSGISYGFIYNAFSELCEVYQNKKLLQKELIKLSNTNDINQTFLYQGNKELSSTETYDKYGRIISSVFDAKTNNEIIDKKELLFEYENNGVNFSKSLERIKKIVDPFANKTYNYQYDIVNNDGSTTITIDSGDNKITTEPNGTKIYHIENDKNEIKYVSENEDQMNNNPKYSYNYIKSKDSNEWTKDVYHSYDYVYDDLGRLICKKGIADEYKNATITINKNINYYKNSNLPKEIRYNVNSKSSQEVNADIIYENSYAKGNIIKFKETGTRFLQNPKNDDALKTTSLEEVDISYEYDDNNRLIKETKSNGDTLFYSYGINSGMIEKVSKNNYDNVIKALTYTSGKLTKINNNDIIYDSYGNTIGIGNIQLIYNSRNLLENYLVNNEKITFEYNYQKIRCKKRCSNYEVNYYLDENKIIGEDVLDLRTSEIIRKFRYLYNGNGVCGINYIINGVDHYYNLVKDSLGNISKVMYRGKIIGEYTYDAWGNCQVKVFEDTNPNEIDRCIVNNNPFRYKGYYYDIEAEFFYCNSRYYSPELCRWLTSNSIEYLDPESKDMLKIFKVYYSCFNKCILFQAGFIKKPKNIDIIIYGVIDIVYKKSQ